MHRERREDESLEEFLLVILFEQERLHTDLLSAIGSLMERENAIMVDVQNLVNGIARLSADIESLVASQSGNDAEAQAAVDSAAQQVNDLAGQVEQILQPTAPTTPNEPAPTPEG